MCKATLELKDFSIDLTGNGGKKLIIPNRKYTEGVKVAIMAPSGFGKSSLLKGIASLSIGHDLSPVIKNPPNLGVLNSKIAYLPQDSRDIVLPWKTVAGQIHNDAKNIIEKLGLDAVRDRYPRDLSGGELRRVALGHLMSLKEKQLYLLDEPFNGLDKASRDRAIGLVLDKTQQNRALLFFITHYQEEADLMGAEILYLDKLFE